MNRMRLTFAAFLLLAAGCSAARYDHLAEKSPADFPSLYPDRRLALGDGMEISYVQAGKGFPLVFLHGIGADHHQWNYSLPHFARNFRVVAVDLPGHGKSARPPGYGYSLEAHAAAVLKLLDHLKIERAVLVGNSMGGMVALHLAVDRPRRVERLVLVGPAGAAAFGWHEKIVGRLLAWFDGLKYVDESAIRAMKNLVVTANRDCDVVEGFIKKLLVIKRDPRLVVAFHKAVRRSLYSILDSTLHQRVGRIAAPTLIVWGKNDKIISLASGMELHGKIPSSFLAVFDETGHVPSLERPELFHRKVDLFLETLRERPDAGVRPVTSRKPPVRDAGRVQG